MRPRPIPSMRRTSTSKPDQLVAVATPAACCKPPVSRTGISHSAVHNRKVRAAGVRQSERRAKPIEKTRASPAICRVAHFGGRLRAKTNSRKNAATDAFVVPTDAMEGACAQGIRNSGTFYHQVYTGSAGSSIVRLPAVLYSNPLADDP